MHRHQPCRQGGAGVEDEQGTGNHPRRAQRLDEEALAKASDLSLHQQAVIRLLIGECRYEQSEWVARRFRAGWSLGMVISEMNSLLIALQKIEAKLTGESQ